MGLSKKILILSSLTQVKVACIAYIRMDDIFYKCEEILPNKLEIHQNLDELLLD